MHIPSWSPLMTSNSWYPCFISPRRALSNLDGDPFVPTRTSLPQTQLGPGCLTSPCPVPRAPVPRTPSRPRPRRPPAQDLVAAGISDPPTRLPSPARHQMFACTYRASYKAFVSFAGPFSLWSVSRTRYFHSRSLARCFADPGFLFSSIPGWNSSLASSWWSTATAAFHGALHKEHGLCLQRPQEIDNLTCLQHPSSCPVH
ncbi:hypothetical protein QBC45DRAFT_9983 [Copromyces sp. CBS 386.78]|nr:hypothetical protein QBC45DRAFT_9983 [Copromyces sp. CBS 386.78]